MIKKARQKIYQYSKKAGDKIGIDLPYFIENGFWVSINQLIVLISGLTLSVVFARFLIKEVYGTYQLLLSIFSIVSIVSIPGLNTSLARSVAKGEDGSYIKAVKYSFKWSLIGIPVLIIIALYFWIQADTKLSIALIISSVFFPFLYAPNTWMSFLKGKSRFELLARWRIIQMVITTAIISIVAIFFQDHIFGVLLAYLISSVGFNSILYQKSKSLIENNIENNETYSYGRFITRMYFLNLFVNNFDKLIVGLFDVKVLAVYIIALKMLDVIKGFSRSFFSITFPKFAKQSVSVRVSHVVFLFIFGLVISTIIFFTAEYFIPFLFSVKYFESAVFLKKLVWVIPFFFTFFFLVQKVSAQKVEKKILNLQVYPSLSALLISLLVLLITNNIEYFVLSKIYVLYIVSFFIVSRG